MFEKNTFIIRVKDGFIEIRDKKLKEVVINSIPYEIYRDGNILDYHHFYYKFKKIFDDLEFIKNDELLILLDSTEFIHINYKIPMIDENEISDFLKLELEDYGDFRLEDYKIIYDYLKENDVIELSIELIPKDIINVFKKILNKLEVNNYNIYPEYFFISEDGKFSEIATEYFTFYEINKGLVSKAEKVYIKNLRNLYINNKLEEKNVSNIINRRYDPEETKIEDDFLLKFENYFVQNIDILERFSNNENINIYGRIANSNIIKNILESFSNIRFTEINGNIFNKKLKINNKQKKKINFINLFLIIGFAGIIVFNIFSFNKINNKISLIPDVKLDESARKVENSSSDKYQESNKKFLEYVKEVQKLEDKDLVITNYNFDNGKMIIRGIVKDEDFLKSKFKDFEILSKNIYKENGFNKFELQIK